MIGSERIGGSLLVSALALVGCGGPGSDSRSSEGGGTEASTGAPASTTPVSEGSSEPDSGPGPDADVTTDPAATTTVGPTTGPDPDDTGSSTGDAPDEPRFGRNCVQQIYPTSLEKAEPWMLGFGDWESRTLSFGDVSGQGIDTVVEAAGQVRMSVLAVELECDGISDHAQALEQGYMCSEDDWSDFEMTGYVQLVEGSDSDNDHDITWYGASGRHTGSGWPDGCLGAGYKGSYHYVDGQVRIGKESWHVQYDWREWTDVRGGVDLTGAPELWLGMKLVRYRFERDGEAGIRNELWLDLTGTIDDKGCPANAWELVRVEEDHPSAGSWGEAATECMAATDDQIIFWGGPRATWRWDGTTARLRLMDVREIEAPRSPPPP